ncbi:hypothetical protein BURPS1710A_4169 [Burkholderia pseudomallei 1710a]|uniref:Uncharacterized protein n=1 Tax=Burkholderia pseudomallei 1710a TaxID=320371 RepID=A0A0E1W7L7_BURPE|nr:hypothetical protein BURPS1710A_4169 [Burkholderia pseudomallei 1710a]
MQCGFAATTALLSDTFVLLSQSLIDLVVASVAVPPRNAP